MKRLTWVAMIVVVISVFAPAAHAQRGGFPPLGANTVLTTSPLRARGDSDQDIACNVVNVSGSPVTVTIAGFSNNGIIVHSATVTVPPKQAESLIFIPEAQFGYCAFAFTGNKDAVRAVAQSFARDHADNLILQGVSEAR